MNSRNIAVATRKRAALAVVLLLGAGLYVSNESAFAAVTAVKGSACSYYVKLGLFGGPQSLFGCGEGGRLPAGDPAPGNTDPSYSPHVVLPADGNGSGSPITATDPDGAKAEYGPAVIHGGLWPEDVASKPPSGPQRASTSGTTGAAGSVTSSASITLNPQPYPEVACASGFSPPPGHMGCLAPGGWGGAPVWGDSLQADCSATETAVTGSTTFSNAHLATATDAGGAPLESATENIPDQPPVNYTKSGVVTNVGDVFAVVFNQQIVNADGSLTVNAMHMYLFGPTAVGEAVRGQVTCGVTPSPLAPADTVAPTCGTLLVEPVGPDDPTPKVPRTELIGVFDAGNGSPGSGIQTIENIQSSNATVQVGNPDGAAYLQFTAGQTGPLAITATIIDESQPMSWSFDATDAAGNTTHCPASESTTTTTTGGGGNTTTTGGGGNTTTTKGGGGGTTSTTRAGGGGTTTTTKTLGAVTVSPSTVAPGGTVQVSSSDWKPDSDVTAVLRSDPVMLGTLTANASGAVSGSLTIPAATATGTHTLELSGIGPNGTPRTVSTPLTVATSSGTGAGGTSTGGDPVTVSGGALSRTGFNSQPFAYLASLSLAFGALLVIGGRRRRAAAAVDADGRR
ncbi:MAG TPA: hypothetical protein VF711_01215 [Acidimicrobiales bacterium]